MNKTKNYPLLASAQQAAELLGVSRSHFYALHTSGRLGPLPVKLGRRALWVRGQLELWAEKNCPPRMKWLELQNGED